MDRSPFGYAREPEAGLRLRLLGSFEAWQGERSLRPREWRLQRAALVLKYLAVQEGRWVPTEVFLDLFWPDTEPARARSTFRTTVYWLRHALEPGLGRYRPSSYLSRGPAGYRLRTEGPIWLDTLAFRATARQALAEGARGRLEQAVALGVEALGHYRGDLLEEEPYLEWAVPEREALRVHYLQLVLHLSRWLGAGPRPDHERALAILAEGIRRGPEHEALYQETMWHLAALDRRADAARVYQACQAALRRELGVSPSSETRCLYHRIVAGQPVGEGWCPDSDRWCPRARASLFQEREAGGAALVPWQTFCKLVRYEEHRPPEDPRTATVLVVAREPGATSWRPCTVAPDWQAVCPQGAGAEPAHAPLLPWQEHLVRRLRRSDLACPLGPDRLAILLAGTDLEGARRLVHRLLRETGGSGAGEGEAPIALPLRAFLSPLGTRSSGSAAARPGRPCGAV